MIATFVFVAVGAFTLLVAAAVESQFLLAHPGCSIPAMAYISLRIDLIHSSCCLLLRVLLVCDMGLPLSCAAS